MYKVCINVEGVEYDEYNMYSNTYLTKLRNIPISLEPYQDIGDDLDVTMTYIIKSTRTWVRYTTKKRS